ncbi:MAG: RNA-binding protein [Bacteroidota bacterium]
MRLRVSSIDPSMDKHALQELFEEFGGVVSIKIFRSLDGTTPVFGFVEMKREREGEEALKALNGQQFGNSKLKVEHSYEHVSSHNKAPVIPTPDEEEDDDYDDEEDDNQIKEIPLDELEEEI